MDYAQKQSIDKKVLEANKAASENYVSTFGTASDRVSKDDWLKKVAEIAAADLERIKQGKEPILARTAGTFFDIMDTDNDGYVTLEDFKLRYGAIGWDSAGAELVFKAANKNNSGKIGREDIVKSAHDVWYKVGF